MKKLKRSKKDLLKTAEAKAWKLKSEYVRRLENGVCYTCGARVWDEERGENNWKIMQAGHYKHGVLDHDDMNIHCQCIKCNHFLSGNLGEYTFKLIEQYGCEAVNDLRQRAAEALKGKKMTLEDYTALIVRYKQLLAELP